MKIHAVLATTVHYRPNRHQLTYRLWHRYVEWVHGHQRGTWRREVLVVGLGIVGVVYGKGGREGGIESKRPSTDNSTRTGPCCQATVWCWAAVSEREREKLSSCGQTHKTQLFIKEWERSSSEDNPQTALCVQLDIVVESFSPVCILASSLRGVSQPSHVGFFLLKRGAEAGGVVKRAAHWIVKHLLVHVRIRHYQGVGCVLVLLTVFSMSAPWMKSLCRPAHPTVEWTTSSRMFLAMSC